MRHSSWDTLIGLIGEIAERRDGSIYDYRTGKSWDPGQAVCAELYGEHWYKHPSFLMVAQRDSSDPVPVGALEAARRVLAGEPAWLQEPAEEGAAR